MSQLEAIFSCFITCYLEEKTDSQTPAPQICLEGPLELQCGQGVESLEKRLLAEDTKEIKAELLCIESFALLRAHCSPYILLTICWK